MVPLVACYEITGANLAIGFLVGLMTGRPALLPTVLHRRPPVDTTRAVYGLGRPVPEVTMPRTSSAAKRFASVGC